MLTWGAVTALALRVLASHARSASASAMKTPSINWFDCPQNASIATTCGTLHVPLDYTATTSNESLILQLVKINATTQPSKGSILFDFGGPGNINVDNFAGSNGQALLLITGGTHDLITFEPRGTGITLPYSCYKSSAGRAAATAATPQALNASDTAIGAVWAAAEALSETCFDNAGEYGQFVGTAFVARDMMQIVDALGEDGLLRYYGFSYGTVLGATVAAMFPDRIDKLLLDGVVNPTHYWAGTPFSYLLDTDATLSAFFAGCIESPELCSLARNYSSAGDISRRIASLVEALKFSPQVLGPDNPTEIVTYGSLKAAIVTALYFPSTWSSLADMLTAVLDNNLTEYVGAGALGLSAPSLFPDLSGPEHTVGIQCADGSLRSDNLTNLLPFVARFESESWIRGDGDVAIQTLQCARWKFISKERYSGTFDDIRTKNPALIVGNSIDPTNPLASARNVSEGFKGSVLLQNNGYGHTTLASPSLCISEHVRAYFLNGTMPLPDTVCESITSTQPFAFDGSYFEVISALANVTKRSSGGQKKDGEVALFNAVRNLGNTFAQTKTGLRAN